MTTLLYIDFPYQGPFGPEAEGAFRDLAASIAKEPGIIRKIWIENQDTHEAGGVYLFSGRRDAEAYLDKHTARLEAAGVRGIKGKFFSVNEKLSDLATPK